MKKSFCIINMSWCTSGVSKINDQQYDRQIIEIDTKELMYYKNA